MTQTYTPPASEIEARETAFRDAEASLLLEGLDPTGDLEYQEQRAQIIAGTLTVDDAVAATRARYTALAQQAREFALAS